MVEDVVVDGLGREVDVNDLRRVGAALGAVCRKTRADGK